MADTNTGGTGGANGGTTGGTPPPATPPDWTAGFSEEQKAFVTTKGYKGPVDILDSYRNLEKLHGVPQDRIIKLPEKMDSPEGRAVWERLGAPKDPKEYEIKTPENGDPQASEAVAKALHSAAIPKDKAQQFIKEVEAYNAQRNTALQEAAKAKQAASELQLKKDWGAAYEQNTNLAKEAARVIGISAQEVDALVATKGHDFVMKAFHKLSKGVTEADFIGGKSLGNGIMAPDQARVAIKELQKDRGFREKLLSGDREAKAKWDTLHEQAFPGNY